jgi:hypothetical protein
VTTGWWLGVTADKTGPNTYSGDLFTTAGPAFNAVPFDPNNVVVTPVGNATFTVTGEVNLLMTDFGIAPPKAMLGMLKTDPKVTVTFETVLGVPLT